MNGFSLASFLVKLLSILVLVFFYSVSAEQSQEEQSKESEKRIQKQPETAKKDEMHTEDMDAIFSHEGGDLEDILNDSGGE